MDKDNEKDNTKETPPEDEVLSENQIEPEMNTKEAYFKLLRVWVNQANMSQNALACFPYYLMANYPQMFQMQGQQPSTSSSNDTTSPRQDQNGTIGGQGVPPNAAPAAGERRIGGYFDNEARQEEIINQNGGYEFVIAPFWKRFVAELVDVAILLVLKLMVTLSVADFLDLTLGIEFDLEALKKSIEDDYTEFLSFSSELVVFEVLTRIAACFYEALWTMTGHVYIGGATPGKLLMGIRIVHVTAVVPLPPGQAPLNMNNNPGTTRALLFPATNPGFKRAFIRAVAKNILMFLLFPMCFFVMLFRNNRTAYDIATKTIVVEENHTPVLRRR